MLQYLDKDTTTEQQFEEAFCRDIDAFNSLFVVSIKIILLENFANTEVFLSSQLDDGNRPSDCEEVPKEYCAVLYDSRDCTGGWFLKITDGVEK